jgi:hypothetical protein
VPDTARALAAACAGLADATAPAGETGRVPDLRDERAVDDVSPRGTAGQLDEQLAAAEASLFGAGAGTGPGGDEALRALLHLHATLAELAPGQRPTTSTLPTRVGALR